MSPSFPDHSALISPEVLSVIERAGWQTAKSVEHVAGGSHQYIVRGWDKDDVLEPEFWLVVDAIKAHGRAEVWVPPPSFYDSGSRKPQRNRYLYPGDGYAYWYTRSRSAAMLNREDISVQAITPTRRPVGDPPEQTQLDF